MLRILLSLLLALLAGCGGASGSQQDARVTPTAAPSTSPLPADLPALELAMRTQLAQTLGQDVSSISVVVVRPVTWPNGCAGLERPGIVCAQVVTPGFEAVLEDAGGVRFTFRGAGQHFALVAP